MTDDQQHALVAQRRAKAERDEREAIAVELAGLRRDAERARWCEEKQADVDWSEHAECWTVIWMKDNGKVGVVRGDIRNDVIDVAMKEDE